MTDNPEMMPEMMIAATAGKFLMAAVIVAQCV